MMKYSITLSSFKEIFESPTDALPMIERLNYDAVEFIGEDDSSEDLDNFTENLASYDLKVSGVTGMWGNLNRSAASRRLLSYDAKTVKIAKRYVIRCVELCRRLGGQEFNICLFTDPCTVMPDFSHRVLSPSDKFAVVNKSIPILRNLSNYAGDHGVLLLLEPLNRYATPYCCTAADALDICKAVDNPSFGILLDTFHMNIEEGSFSRALESTRDFLHHMHFADNNRKMPGEGHLDFGSILRGLHKINYQQYISFEPILEKMSYLESLRKGMAHIRNLNSTEH
ncbi:MAG TPA: sugar phosphate isomerase/epimerase [Nitrososphaeraceae archaeon]|nr:sugar phosphate isomerase/epimerase [Nitrososphaeraceae archaeon]